MPFLVYDFDINGTLCEYIHEICHDQSPLSWELRVKITVERADIFAYLHSECSVSIIHRDIKMKNILLY